MTTHIINGETKDPETLKKEIEQILKAVAEMHDEAKREDLSCYNYSYFDGR